MDTLLLIFEMLFVSGAIVFLYHLRSVFGLTPLCVFVGANQYLQTILLSTFYVPVTGGHLVSPGSVVLFSASIVTFLLLYLREGVAETRSLLHGIVLANVSLTALSLFVQAHLALGDVSNFLGIPEAIFNVDPRLFLAGTATLIIDVLVLIACYELLFPRIKGLPLVARVVGTLAITLSIDAIVFITLGFAGKPVYGAMLASNLVGKCFSGVIYGLVLYGYLRGIEGERGEKVQQLSDMMSLLSYQDRYRQVVAEKEQQERDHRDREAEAQRALEASELRYRSLFELAQDGLVVVRLDGHRIVAANASLAVMLGWDRDDLEGRTLAETPLVSLEAQVIQLAEEGGDSLRTEGLELYRKDGTFLPVEVVGGVSEIAGHRIAQLNLRDINERQLRVEAALRARDLLERRVALRTRELEEINTTLREEMTARLRAQGALGESEQRYRRLVELMPTAVVIHQQGRIRFCNASATRLVAASSPEQLVGRRVLDLVHPDDQALVQAGLEAEPVDEGDVQQQEFRLARLDSRLVIIRAMATAFLQQDERAVLVVLEDVTEQRRLEAMKDEFVSTVSHELRTPMTAIKGSLSLLASGIVGELPERAGELTTIALDNSERLIRLINDLLDIQKMEAGGMSYQLEWVALNGLLEQAIDLNRDFAEQCGVELVLRAGVSEAHVQVDPERLLQVLTNLLSNAAKFSPRQAAIEVETRLEGERVRIEVHDRGPGIPEDFRAQLFDRFSQVDGSASRAARGTGLGLSIAKAIVEHLGGEIGHENRQDGGSTFYFYLPLAGAEA